jgi:hypothetical protein
VADALGIIKIDVSDAEVQSVFANLSAPFKDEVQAKADAVLLLVKVYFRLCL